MYFALCFLVFAAGYVLSLITISVGYHRGLAHGAVRLHPVVRRLVVVAGNWITGLDPKAWVVMHRLHHEHSDTPLDPHSPTNCGLFGIFREQLRSYKRAIVGLTRGNPVYTQHARDLDFPINPLNTSRLWFLPYALHALIGVGIGVSSGAWLLGVAYFAGMMGHPLQGGIVNALGHAVGPRNFDTDDNSRNNFWAALLILGEGFQNNHHRYPASAKFSYRPSEIDLGWGVCVVGDALGLWTIERAMLIPKPGTVHVAAPSPEKPRLAA